MKVENWAQQFLMEARIGHLATSTKEGRPFVVPLCFAYDKAVIYSVIDEKPKRSNPSLMRRVLNIASNPQVSLVVDRYEEDWSKLIYVIVWGFATIIHRGKDHDYAISLLRQKYPQYAAMKLEDRPVVRIDPVRVKSWAARQPEPPLNKGLFTRSDR